MQQEEQHFNIQPVQILNIMRGKPEQEEKQCVESAAFNNNR